jgi:hypothetical protein
MKVRLTFNWMKEGAEIAQSIQKFSHLYGSVAIAAEARLRVELGLSHGTFLANMIHDRAIHCIMAKNILCMEIDDAEHLALARPTPRILAKDIPNGKP